MRLYLKNLYVGQILGSGQYRSFITERTLMHFFRKYQGFGLSIKTLMVLEEKYHISRIIIDYYGFHGKITYISNLVDWYQHGVCFQNTISPYDEQLILPTRYMETRKGKKICEA